MSGVADDVVDGNGTDDVAVASKSDLDLKVEIQDVGPCKKHIAVTITEQDIQQLREETVSDLSREAAIPGFRAGKVPEKLLARRFRKEISDQLKQKLLLQSLEQVSEQHSLDPINEPELDVENLEVPESGDFEYEFEVEVRPVFEVPNYSKMSIKRPVHDVTDADVEAYRQIFLSRFAQISPSEGPVEAGDYVVCDCEFRHNGEVIQKFDEITVRVRPTLRFWDAEVTGFQDLIIGTKVGDTRSTKFEISREANNVEMRSEQVEATFKVVDIKRMTLPELDNSLLERINFDSIDELNQAIRNILTRQVSYRQRQETREQVLEKITESASWDLPEGLVKKHVENALRREILEMQQAGFSRQQIIARESEIRQKSHSSTQQALKEHFVLDKVASDHDIECTQEDMAEEIVNMASQQGESPRKLRARLAKSGMLENLEAQIRERKAVDYILTQVSFEDYPIDNLLEDDIESVKRSITSSINDAVEAESEEDTDEE
ncbi:MAG: trigger factor [Planctomycetaceae bacterium]|nr:trigger factor [Planctomycetaceae bacterium]